MKSIENNPTPDLTKVQLEFYIRKKVDGIKEQEKALSFMKMVSKINNILLDARVFSNDSYSNTVMISEKSVRITKVDDLKTTIKRYNVSCEKTIRKIVVMNDQLEMARNLLARKEKSDDVNTITLIDGRKYRLKNKDTFDKYKIMIIEIKKGKIIHPSPESLKEFVDWNTSYIHFVIVDTERENDIEEKLATSRQAINFIRSFKSDLLSV